MMDEALKLENQLCFPLYACARRVIGRYTPYLKPLNLTYTQYIVLLVLWEEKEATVRELCRKLYLDSGTLTPLLKKMESQGYVIRRRNADDERVVTVRLTDAGEALKERAREIPGRIAGCIQLSEQEILSLYGILYKVLDQIGEEE
ncbi:MAG: MarR family transcriptional regulator [Clostridia bacterium]|nr:MarR family transcriptional regulator [Clostridia bacterium]MBR0217258.1 MarR family transcriptional regulator [Clostridia bacterium]